MINPPQILLATGGTAGHIFPAVALARALEPHGLHSAIIGGLGGMEEGIATRENLGFYGVRTGKIDRSRPDPRALFRALAGFWDAAAMVGKLRPKVVVGFGGFASFPGVAGAWLRGVPIVLHEGNARPGLVTKVFARSAKMIGLVDEAAKLELVGAKTKLVGMPVREQRMTRSEALEKLGLEPNKQTIFIMGGSQGSVRLNKLLPPILERVLAGKNVQVLHQTGHGRLGEVKSSSWYHTTEFVDAIAAFSAADFAITRAGMSSIADAAFHGVPLLLVPLPSASEDHQTKNAQSVEARGAGFLIPESALELESLSSPEAPKLLESGILACLDASKLEELRRNAFAASSAGAAERLAALVLEVIQRETT
jgi:UDP-N-acetylglucosamine--N-acetylmuramyl-(pentapeptide) pyrophosphoryl-undecaprenol N-acetylglucosamine transferase